ncbi:MAG: WD40 repeat domain-containing protein [Chloroflexi bacterium]|nr:WD40 repeat domain-containing protein [Chloroflexota bacterium]
MSTLATLIHEILDDSFDGTLSQEELIPRIELKTMAKFDPVDLLELWHKGEIFVSAIVLGGNGYQPTADCKWTTERSSTFFGYGSNLGAYQISDTLLNPLSVSLEFTISLNSPASSIAVSPGGQLLVTGEKNGTISIISLENGQLVKRDKTSPSCVWAIAFSSDGKRFATGHENGSVLLWNHKCESVDKSADGNDCVKGLSFSPDGMYLLSAHKKGDSEQPLVRRWTTAPLRHRDSYYYEQDTVWDIQYLPDGTGFVCAGHAKFVTCVSFEKADPIFREKKHTGAVTCLNIHPQSGVVVSGAWTGGIKIWSLSDGKNLKSIEAHTTRVTDLAFSKSGHLLASCEKDSRVSIWQMPDCRLVGRVEAHKGWVRGIAFITDLLFATVGSDNACRVWRIDYQFPELAPRKRYTTAEEVQNDYRRADNEDDE